MRVSLSCRIEDVADVLSILTDNLEAMSEARDGYGWTFSRGREIRAFVRKTKTGFSVRQYLLKGEPE